jgi:hypothetical protein
MRESKEISASVYRCSGCGATSVFGDAEWRTREPFGRETLRNVTSDYDSHSFEPEFEVIWLSDPPPAYRGLYAANSGAAFILLKGGRDNPRTDPRPVPGVHGEFTHDGMNTARLVLIDRDEIDGDESLNIPPQGDVSDVWNVRISWTGTGPIKKTTYPTGVVERTRYAVVSMRASYKGEVLLDIAGQPGPARGCV